MGQKIFGFKLVLDYIFFDFFCFLDLLFYWWNPNMVSLERPSEHDTHLLVIMKTFLEATKT